MAEVKKYQVFISSTYIDLKEERREAMIQLLAADAIPAGMELFHAADDEQFNYIKEVINECDYYVLIVGGRYGSLGPDGRSYTEMEYDFAIQKRKPIMTFLKNVDKVTFADVDDKVRVEAFRTKVTASKMCRFFDSAKELGGLVAGAYNLIKRRQPAEGWIRGGSAMTPETETELATLRLQVNELKSALAKKEGEREADVSGFSQGDDTTPPLHVSAIRPSDNKEYMVAVQPTWNFIFQYVAPPLIGEVKEFEFRIQVAKALSRFVGMTMATTVKQDRNPSMMDDSYATVKVQFMVLGLIQKGTRRRNPSDNAQYFTLTPAGERTLMRLRAIRKPEGSDEDNHDDDWPYDDDRDEDDPRFG